MQRLTLIFLLMILAASAFAQSFVRVEGTRFIRDGQPYSFIGTNFWYGMNLASRGEGGDRSRLLRELDRLQALGVTNLRIMAAGEGPETEPWRIVPALQPTPGEYRDELLDGLDFLLAELARRGMVAVVCLNNFWQWSGGMAQYRAWFGGGPVSYPDPDSGAGWFSYMTYSSGFYKNKEAVEGYNNHLRTIITRVNSYTGRPYCDEPAIMAWQLANEPRGMLRPKAFRRWIRRTARFIKELDPNHLVCTGSEGNTNVPTGNHFRKDHQSGDIDYTTIHIWVQNWGWYEADRPAETYAAAIERAESYLQRHLDWAQKLGKPLVLEEFGIARDGDSHDPAATTGWRDRFYEHIFSRLCELARQQTPAAGGNFWAWSGEGRPREPRTIWQRGDEWTGDPPHERQGWYSVYDTDRSTLEIIRKYTAIMNERRSDAEE